MKLSERLQALSYLSPDEFKELQALEAENEKLREAAKEILTKKKWYQHESEALETEVERLRAICENVGELLSTMEDAHLQTAWHILDNAGFTKKSEPSPTGGGKR